MGWQVKIKEENNVTKYRIWTTISDGWITDWLTKEEITKFFFWHRFRKFMENFLEDAMTFPNKYTKKGTNEIILNDDLNSFNEFMSNSFKEGNENIVLNKFSEIINSHGIELNVNDIDGYFYHSKEELNESRK